jgi:hypothetical protein
LRSSRGLGGRFGDQFELTDIVLRLRNSGMNVTIATRHAIVPKKIVGELIKGAIRNGPRTPANTRPNASPKMWPRPRSPLRRRLRRKCPEKEHPWTS